MMTDTNGGMQEHGLEIESRNKCDLVMDRILEFVTNGEYKPGDRLPPENYFSERFGVSRVTVRESIKKLSSMGVVTVKHGQGTFVNKVSPSTLMLQLYPLMMLNKDDLGQLYDARIALESSIAELAARSRTQEDVTRMKALLSEMEGCLKGSDTVRYSQLDIELHTLIGNAAKNEILLTIYQMLDEVRKRGIYMSNRGAEDLKHSLNAHSQLVEAIENGDGEAARVTMMHHLQYSKSAAVGQIVKP
jgi:GntR family transcriptional repressor for pyruvate dehydrogenase complex